MRFDPRPRKANGTLETKLSREAYINQTFGSVQAYNNAFDVYTKKLKELNN